MSDSCRQEGAKRAAGLRAFTPFGAARPQPGSVLLSRQTSTLTPRPSKPSCISAGSEAPQTAGERLARGFDHRDSLAARHAAGQDFAPEAMSAVLRTVALCRRSTERFGAR